MSGGYLKPGVPAPAPAGDGLDAPFWAGLAENRLLVQRCNACSQAQWGPEWICHHCLSFDMGWIEIAPTGRIYSWQRCWHPVMPELKEQGPYLIGLVELPGAGNVRMVGNLLGDPLQDFAIGAAVEGVFEHHREGAKPYSLLQWAVVG